MSAVLPMATVTSLDLPNEVAETRATSPQRRIEWMDTARGIAIILVVYGHVLVGLHHLLMALRLAPLKRPTATHIEYRLKATAGA